jgi:hypothetical protein
MKQSEQQKEIDRVLKESKEFEDTSILKTN